MDSIKSGFCNDTIIISVNDFVWITMGSGIGYFLICYLIIDAGYNIYKRRWINSQEVIPAVQV